MSIRKIVLSLPVMLLTVLLLSAAVWAASKTGVITGDTVNVRAEPDTSAKIIAKLDKGARVAVIGNQSDWFKVSINDTTGWINDDYLTIRDDLEVSETPGGSASSGSVSIEGTVTGSVVNVRSKPDISSDILTKLEQGAKVTISDQSGDWYKISLGDDKYGWANKEYISTRSQAVSRGSTDVRPPVDSGDSSVDSSDDSNVDNDQSDDDNSGDLRQRIVSYAKKFIGVRYVYGGSTPKGFDCSGFVSYVYKHFGITLERSSADMGRGGTAVDKADLQPGDLVFFDTNGGRNAICHVGIYVGDGHFIHASSGNHMHVMISSLGEATYSRGYMRARDYLD